MNHYFRSFQICIATVFFCSAVASITAQASDETPDDVPDIPAEEDQQPGDTPSSLHDEWRDTLQFGIDSKVIELLSTLESRRETSLNDELRERFQMSSNSELKRKVFDFFRLLEDSSLEEDALDILLYFYDYNNPLIRAAIQYIGAVEIEYQEEAAELLLELAEEDNVAYSTQAVNAVAAMQRKQDAEFFVAMLEDASSSMSDSLREAIILALGTIEHSVAVDALLAILQDDSNPATHRQYAADSLGKIQDPAAIPALEQAIASGENLLRAYAVSALGRFPDVDNSQMLQQALRDSYWRTREVALDGIESGKLVSSLPAIQYMSRHDPEQRIRRKAINTIASLDHPDGWEFIITHLGNDNTPQELRILMMQLSIEKNLANSRDVLMEILRNEWDKENSQILDQMGRKMSTTDNPELEEFLLRLLDHPNFIIRMYAVRGISRNRLSQHRATIEELTEEGHHPALRREAVSGLERL